MYIGDVVLPLHFIFETLAFFIGYKYYAYLRNKHGDTIASANRLSLIIAAALGALIGSRLIGALEQPDNWMQSENLWLYLYTNKTVVGGFVGGLCVVEFVKRLIGERQRSGDLFALPLIVALFIGRIGCFSMGIHEQTYGIKSTLPWAMNLGDGILRHPVVLYEMLFLLFLWFILYHLRSNHILKSGILFQFFMISYLTYRFLQDFIKPVYYWDIVHLSSIQIVCLITLLYYYKTILRIFNHPNSLLL